MQVTVVVVAGLQSGAIGPVVVLAGVQEVVVIIVVIIVYSVQVRATKSPVRMRMMVMAVGASASSTTTAAVTVTTVVQGIVVVAPQVQLPVLGRAQRVGRQRNGRRHD